MSQYQQHKDFFDNPLYVSADVSKQKVKEIIEDFFFNCPLSSARDTLQKLLMTSLTNDSPISNDVNERKQMIWFCTEVEKLLEAIYQNRANP